MKALGKASVVSIVDFDWIRTSVFLLVGTDYAAIRRKFLALLKKRGAPIPIARQRQIFADVEAHARAAFSDDIPASAVCIWPKLDKQTPFIWLSHGKHEDLVHEVTHAVAGIIDDHNLEGAGNSEVRAYLTEYLVCQFVKRLPPLSGNPAGKQTKEQTMKKQTKKPAAKKPCPSCKDNAKGKCKK